MEKWEKVEKWGKSGGQATTFEDAAETAAPRRATRTGRPLGSGALVKRMAAAFGRKPDRKRTGRAKKKAQAAAATKK